MGNAMPSRRGSSFVIDAPQRKGAQKKARGWEWWWRWRWRLGGKCFWQLGCCSGKPCKPTAHPARPHTVMLQAHLPRGSQVCNTLGAFAACAAATLHLTQLCPPSRLSPWAYSFFCNFYFEIFHFLRKS